MLDFEWDVVKYKRCYFDCHFTSLPVAHAEESHFCLSSKARSERNVTSFLMSIYLTYTAFTRLLLFHFAG